jgi:hypothetical protein
MGASLKGSSTWMQPLDPLRNPPVATLARVTSWVEEGRQRLGDRRTLRKTDAADRDNVTIAGGPAPARAYSNELLPDVLDGTIEPGRVFDRVARLDEVPDGYRAMNERETTKVLIEL